MEVKTLKNESLWEQVGNKCLECALTLLDEETAPDINKTRAVENLVATAVSIDLLNLRWAKQTRYAGAVFQGQASGQTAKGN